MSKYLYLGVICYTVEDSYLLLIPGFITLK